jgi:hypothetical protein
MSVAVRMQVRSEVEPRQTLRRLDWIRLANFNKEGRKNRRHAFCFCLTHTCL